MTAVINLKSTRRTSYTVYVNSLLATLNARKHILGRIDDVNHMLVSMPASVLSPYNSSTGKTQPSISIRIETKQEQDGLDEVRFFLSFVMILAIILACRTLYRTMGKTMAIRRIRPCRCKYLSLPLPANHNGGNQFKSSPWVVEFIIVVTWLD